MIDGYDYSFEYEQDFSQKKIHATEYIDTIEISTSKIVEKIPISKIMKINNNNSTKNNGDIKKKNDDTTKTLNQYVNDNSQNLKYNCDG